MSLLRARLRLLAGDYRVWRRCGTSRRLSFRRALRWSFGRDSGYVRLAANGAGRRSCRRTI
jgi:hypothetical protein